MLLSTKVFLKGTTKEIDDWDDKKNLYRNSRYDFKLQGVELPGTNNNDWALVWRAAGPGWTDKTTEFYEENDVDDYRFASCREGFIGGVRNQILDDGRECIYALCTVPSKVKLCYSAHETIN